METGLGYGAHRLEAPTVFTSLDKRVKALVVQLTFASGERMIAGELEEEERNKLASTLQKAQERAVTKNKVLRLNPEQILTDKESQAFYAEMVKLHPTLQTKIPFTTLQHIREHNPQNVIANVTCPILIIAAEDDTVCPAHESQILFESANEPKQLIMLERCKHYDAYEPPPFEKGVQSTIAWFSQYLNAEVKTDTIPKKG
jgi:alpha-beta hydrolase superfamily lysophospholipase